MVSDGGSESYRRDRAALGGLVGAIIFMVAIGMISAALNWGSSTRSIRERAYPIPATQCQQDKSCEEKALQIEAREAVTADVTLDVAFMQLALSLAGVFAVGATLYYAHKAWREAERSANAATKALNQDARQSVHELRAYVFIDTVNILGPIRPGSPIPDIEISFRNSGQTPAYDVSSCVATRFTNVEDAETEDAEVDIVNTLGPGGVFTKIVHTKDVFSDHDFRAIEADIMTVMVSGYVRYRSFGKQRFTNFRYRYAHASEKPVMVICPAGNNADEEGID